MIELTRLSHLHAPSSPARRARHLSRAAPARICSRGHHRDLPHCQGQHAVGLITGQNSLAAIEAALAQISQFLCTSATIAVLIDSRESGVSLKIRGKLEQMGFRIEAGVRCHEGLVLSAWRQGFGQMENAA